MQESGRIGSVIHLARTVGGGSKPSRIAMTPTAARPRTAAPRPVCMGGVYGEREPERAELGEAASMARSAREGDGVAVPPGRSARPVMRGLCGARNVELGMTRATGMPSFIAFSIRLSVMPEPRKAMTPLGGRSSSASLCRKGAAHPWRSQSSLQTIWWTPLRSDTKGRQCGWRSSDGRRHDTRTREAARLE